MRRTQFSFFVSYAQIAVFAAGLDTPFNDWDQEHFDQGFSWREESVSFSTLDEAGVVHGEAVVAEEWHPHPEAVRAIRVPFRVTSENVEIASISDGALVSPGSRGMCALFFETWVDAHSVMQVRITFVRHEGAVTPAVLKADVGLHPPDQLKMTARPA